MTVQLGDLIWCITSALGLSHCEACEKRRVKLNNIFVSKKQKQNRYKTQMGMVNKVKQILGKPYIFPSNFNDWTYEEQKEFVDKTNKLLQSKDAEVKIEYRYFMIKGSKGDKDGRKL